MAHPPEVTVPPADSRVCRSCGALSPRGLCPACPENILERFLHRELVLLGILGAAAAALFLVTRATAEANRGMRLREAAVWFEQGRRHLEAGRASDALAALRRATAIEPDERRYRLALADALVRGTQDDAARQVLLGLRERARDDPDVSRSLARLERRRGDVAAAVRYYENALYGAWPAEQATARRRLRAELIEYLLSRGEHRRALSQLLILGANLPDDVPPQMETAQLFMRAGDPRRALEHFRHVLRLDPDNDAALAGAGEAAFQLADYSRARRYLGAVRQPEARIRALARIAELVVRNDPLAPKLRTQERRRRLLGGVRQASARVDACLSSSSAVSAAALRSLQQEAASMVARAERKRVEHAPDALERGVELIYRMEEATDDAGCEATDTDHALSLIGRRYASDTR
jgi:tetratricopeptide (TPR) repeat protein